ncbi:MAG: tetratricopeptide repeat protein, partial [Bacteroidetes bacterium]|nr:tetratricopeptide repeat protein [Bacteroidota bacterium]
MKRIPVLLAAAALLLAGCSQSLLKQGVSASEQGEYTRAVSLFYQEISANPQSVEAWTGLGKAFFELGNFEKSEDALHQANNIRPDAQATLYLGMIFEKRGDTDKAMEAYTQSLSLDPGGKTRNLIRAHLDYLVGQNIHKEVKNALANEEKIDVDSIPANTVAVADFDASKLSPEMAPIARGLAEFTAIDLAKVKQLRVVDRLKIDVIQQELALSASGMVDPSSAPRVGKLLGSRHLVTATVLGLGNDDVRLDGVVVNTADSSANRTETSEGQLQKVFALQKDFVFRVIDDLGITLTAEERDAIKQVPTESFLAFLAYSRGLEAQSEGRMNDAEAAYNQATAAD